MTKDNNLKQEKLVPSQFEQKRRSEWINERIYQPPLVSAKRPFYNLMMFPYPSAEGLHVGNMYAFTGADIYGRLKRMQGYDVFEPIGLDGFGIHSENYAIKLGRHPREQAKISQKNFYRQLQAIGNGFAWENRLETYDPNYYKWTQWIFVQMFKHGLAYRKKSPVNFCPKDKTVLSDEQVIDGKCERCGTEVEKRDLEQWFFRITKYAERLLQNTFKSSFKWPEKVKVGQRNWIGRSEGVRIEFKIQNSKFKIEVFTTALDTIFGVTFMVVSPEHPLVSQLLGRGKEVMNYLSEVLAKTRKQASEVGRVKRGINTGYYAINPFTGKTIPIWIADYVLMDYGTGAIMGVPGHDARDYEFAQKFKLPIIPVVKPTETVKGEAKVNNDSFWDYSEIKANYSKESILFNSDFLNGLNSGEAKKLLEEKIEKMKIGKKLVTYKLRDWCVSRQRYWGVPIPMIKCPQCGWQPVAEEDLPVLLPDLKDWKPEGTGKGPLAKLKDWIKVACPECGGPARRETDVGDTFLDSSWYFLRYPSVGVKGSDNAFFGGAKRPLPESSLPYSSSLNGSLPSRELRGSKLEAKQTFKAPQKDYPRPYRSDSLPWDPEITRKWLPVNIYIGGAEHTVLHLLYARFVTMAFADWGILDFEEPFSRFYAHGLIIAEGAKMSKSRGNVVVPDEYIKAYGADALRTYLMFLGPFEAGGDFRDTGIAGMYRFLGRVWRLVNDSFDSQDKQFDRLTAKDDLSPLNNLMHKTVKEVTEDLENLRYNTAISHIMEYVNGLSDNLKDIKVDHFRVLLKLLAPFAPYMTEELWQRKFKVKSEKFKAGNERFESIHVQPWPQYDSKYLVENMISFVIQVNGKVRDVIKVKSQKSKVKSEMENIAKNSEKVRKYIDGKKIKKVIFVPGRLINFVV